MLGADAPRFCRHGALQLVASQLRSRIQNLPWVSRSEWQWQSVPLRPPLALAFLPHSKVLYASTYSLTEREFEAGFACPSWLNYSMAHSFSTQPKVPSLWVSHKFCAVLQLAPNSISCRYSNFGSSRQASCSIKSHDTLLLGSIWWQQRSLHCLTCFTQPSMCQSIFTLLDMSLRLYYQSS